ncbi:MAG: DUF3105 domain-containing protein [Candidatus Eremiobacteraeota bacterium]|nr:DUF3105 domain-containing protein [Candidatus Eremiobacteraeota bacterium]
MKITALLQRRAALVVLLAAAAVGCGSATNTGASASATPTVTPSAESTKLPPATAAGQAFTGTAYPSQGHSHLLPGEPDDFVYNSDPPTSGPHREIFSDAFISSTSLPVYLQVHLLEHGNVLLQYSCVCPDVAAALAAIAMRHDQQFLTAGETRATIAEVQNAEDQGKAVIVAPYPHMKKRVALTAWTHLGALSKVDQAKIESFIATHLGNPTE